MLYVKINSNTTWKSVTLTPGENVTIAYQVAYEFGGILFLHARWTAAATLTNYQTVIETGKACKMTWNAPLMGLYNTPVQNYGLYGDTGNTAVRAAGTIPAGTYKMYLVIPIR